MGSSPSPSNSLSPREDRFNYLSIASGGLLQDFTIIGRLIGRGYKNIRISLVDPCLYWKQHHPPSVSESNCLRFFKLFLFQVAKEKGINIQIEAFESMGTLKIQQADRHFHLIQCIDFDDFDANEQNVADLKSAMSHLHELGTFHFSVDKIDLVFNSDQVIFEKIPPDNEMYKGLQDKVLQSVRSK